ncbi:cyclin-A1-4 isoform X1 [Physcomitrium patens]|uniref:cyclin-A1-4 isoform X1 n=1 Tax=Physcomitrium patens TaxID=3218 RepID=UPI000D1709FE|nr:cyclin-A3-1-like isoform X1 [Physcomitrium patens]|eukprot:XP_024396701.1 cyclin-A3-1-like isoform X1 [Physcomitrella patens]
MTGGVESARRLRPRSCSSISGKCLDEVRQTRAAAKRSAMEETASKPGSSAVYPRKRAGMQPVRKRAALSNITNQQSVVQCVGPGNGTVDVRVVGLKADQECRGDKNAHPGIPAQGAGEGKGQGASLDCEAECGPRSNSEAVASLERRTVQNLHISQEAKDRVKQGDLFSDKSCSETSEWSSGELCYEDIDNDHCDPQMCSSYATDIYEHLRMAEMKRRPSANFMESIQQDVNPTMRGILVDWLVEVRHVAGEYRLVPDTLYLAVSYIDRYLSAQVVTRQRLQLLGVACMLIAAKYEEICAPQVEEFCYITDSTYCREEVLEMERGVLNVLKFELTTPTTKSFLRRFVRAAQASCKGPSLVLEFLGNYLAELTLVEYGFLPFLPSMIAASAVYLAKLTLDSSTCPWDATLQHYTGYRPWELERCVRAMHELQRNTKSCSLPAVREKYRQHKFKCVATLVPPAALTVEHFRELE